MEATIKTRISKVEVRCGGLAVPCHEVINVESRCCLEVQGLMELLPGKGEAYPPSKRALRIGSC
jgi:hypothetical protein